VEGLQELKCEPDRCAHTYRCRAAPLEVFAGLGCSTDGGIVFSRPILNSTLACQYSAKTSANSKNIRTVSLENLEGTEFL
jgi:hypothetical protein